MDNEGIIKFECFHSSFELDKTKELKELIVYRNLAYKKKYLGVSSKGIAYGNISLRSGNNFLISGSDTGRISHADARHFSMVEKWNIDKNRLWCKGPVKSSSESLTHAVIYENMPQVKAVLHLHSDQLWRKNYDKIAFTHKNIEYGTTEMAYAVIELLKKNNFTHGGVFLMRGHREGLVAFGKNMKEVFKKIGHL
jgi:L-ribulose-5-phosphate 4-epimerase